MKRFAILLAAMGAMLVANDAFAHCGHDHGRRGGSAFSISIGNGFNGISYGRGFGYGYGVPVAPVYRAPFVPVAPVYGGYGYTYGRPVYGYGNSFNFNYNRGFYNRGFYGGGYRGCGW